MPVTPRGIVTPDDNDDWDLIIDWAANANSIDAALDDLESDLQEDVGEVAGTRFATVFSLLASTPADGSIARADDVPGATFWRESGTWVMYGIPVFDDDTERDAILTAPGTGWLSRLDSNDYIESYDGADWVRFGDPGIAGLLVPASVAGTGVTLDSSTGIVTFSAASSISVNGVFSDDGTGLDSYEIELHIHATSTGNIPRVVLRASGSDNTSSNYDSSVITRNNASVASAVALAQSLWSLNGSNNSIHDATIELIAPAIAAQPTRGRSVADGTANPMVDATQSTQWRALLHRSTAAFDGFTVNFSTGNGTGVLVVRKRL